MTIPPFIHFPSDVHLGSFQFGDILNRDSVFVYMPFSVHIDTLLLDIYLSLRLLGHRVCICLVSFKKASINLHSHQQCARLF